MSTLPKIKVNWKVAITFSALLPVLNILNNSQHQVEINWNKTILNWIVTFCFLLASWVVNSELTFFFEKSKIKNKQYKKIGIILLCNLSLLAIFIAAGVFVINDFNTVFVPKSKNLIFILSKGFLSISLIYIFQYALNTNAWAQRVSLQNQALKTENIRAQFEILRQQVNPHFLFNSLSTLRSMIRSNNKKSETFVIKLSEIYRQILLKKEIEIISLKEELDFIKDYSFMLFSRFENMLSIDIEISEKLLNLKIPTFSLQMLLENCVKHNIISKEKPLKIKIFNSGNDNLIIDNNLQSKISQAEHSGYGLKNLVQRYTLLGFPNGISVFSDEAVFRVKIKLLNL